MALTSLMSIFPSTKLFQLNHTHRLGPMILFTPNKTEGNTISSCPAPSHCQPRSSFGIICLRQENSGDFSFMNRFVSRCKVWHENVDLNANLSVDYSLFAGHRACLHQASASTLPQLSDDASNTVLIESNGVPPEWSYNQFSSNSIVFNENIIASMIAELSQHRRRCLVYGPLDWFVKLQS